jgi:hypothetical protein
MKAAALAMTLAPLFASCVGTTGGEVIEFRAAAAGPADAQAGRPLQFVSDHGWNVVLSSATLHVGAIYLSRSKPVSGVGVTSCILPDTTYIAEVTTGRDVDLLSPEPQPFPAPGACATSPPAIVGQVWLTNVQIDKPDDTKPILQLTGTAEKEGDSRPFQATITIGKNRTQTNTDATQAGAYPICKERIVSPISTYITLKPSGSLLLRIDPRTFFVNVDFATLPPSGDGFAFSNEAQPNDQASINLYSQLKKGTPYSFEWVR